MNTRVYNYYNATVISEAKKGLTIVVGSQVIVISSQAVEHIYRQIIKRHIDGEQNNGNKVQRVGSVQENVVGGRQHMDGITRTSSRQ